MYGSRAPDRGPNPANTARGYEPTQPTGAFVVDRGGDMRARADVALDVRLVKVELDGAHRHDSARRALASPANGSGDLACVVVELDL